MHTIWLWPHNMCWKFVCLHKPTVEVKPCWYPCCQHILATENHYGGFYKIELLLNLLNTFKWLMNWDKKNWKGIDETYNNLHKMFFSPNQQLRSNLVDRHRRHMAAAGSNRESLYQLHLSDKKWGTQSSINS